MMEITIWSNKIKYAFYEVSTNDYEFGKFELISELFKNDFGKWKTCEE
jgi:hypothetical protein